MDQPDQLYLSAQFLFLLQWSGIFGGLIPVPTGDLHQRTTTLLLPPKGAVRGEGVKAQSHTILVVDLVAGEVKGKKKVYTCSSLPTGAGHMHTHFTGPDSALGYSGVIITP